MIQLQDKIARYEGFLVVDPENTTLLVALGDLYHQSGQFDKASSQYSRVLQLESDHAVAQSRLASLLMSQGQVAKALESFNQLLAAGHNDPSIELNAAICQFSLYQFDQAQAQFSRLAGEDAVGRSARFYLASILQVNNRVEEALIEVERLLAEAGELYLYAYKSSLLYTLGRLDESVELANLVLGDDDSNPDACSTLGTFYIENLETDLAVTFFEKLIARAPGDARGWHGLGMAAMQNSQMSVACDYLFKAVELLPQSSAMWTTLAWAQFNSQQYREAEQSFAKVVDLDRNNPEGWGGKACSLAMQTRLDEANQVVEYALRLDKRSFSAVFAKSLILAIGGNKEVGERVLSKLLEQPIRPGGEKAIDTINRFMQKRNAQDDALNTVASNKQIH